MAESSRGRRVRWSEFDRLTNLRGWSTDAERARQIGISEQQLNHMRRGRSRAGAHTVDRILQVFGSALYDVLFERGDEDAA
jgi:transcriptional regulator with XRE-family HTH domain